MVALPASRRGVASSHWDPAFIPSANLPERDSMRVSARCFLAFLLSLLAAAPSWAEDFAFPRFALREVVANGTTIHVRSGGSGPAVLLLHGYGDTGDPSA